MVLAMTAPSDDDPFYSAGLRISRAQEHLETLEAQVSSFFAEKPYTHIVEADPNGTHEIHKIRVTKPFPFRWRILATEIIEHLRAALDHAVWTTAYLSTGNPNVEFAAFPFSNNSANFENRMRGLCKDVPSEIQALLKTFEPYKEGNDLLYMLNDMCNLSKHALIAFVGCATASGQIKGAGWTSPVEFYEAHGWDRAKHEIPYARVRRGSHFQHEVDFRIYVSIEHREIITGEPATLVFDAMGREVDAICSAIIAESRKIGLLK
jgi:hypothetical protein